MVRPKPKSKRTPVRLRHKIEKASAAKQRKQRKLAKKDPQWRSRLKKDPGIPNLFPYKDKLLAEIEEKKRLKAEEAARKRKEGKSKNADVEEGEDRVATDEGALEDGDDELVSQGEDVSSEDDMAVDQSEDDGSNPMAALLESARARAAEYEQDGGDYDEDDIMDEDDDSSTWDGVDDKPGSLSVGSSASVKKDSSRRAFDKVFKEVVDASDVVLYVLDARDPEGLRSKEVERMVMAAEGGNKRLILVLNKIDLVPPKVLKDWLIHLRRYFPTLPLRASNPASNAHTFNHKTLTVKGTSETLFKALKSYAHSKQLKRSISVGVIGYPNVGKSSIINALTSRLGNSKGVCPVGAEAGVTTSLREIKLDNKLKLIDSPGIVFPTTTEGSKLSPAEEQARLVLLNAIPPKQIEDPVAAVSLLVRRLSTSPELEQKLLDVYGLPPLIPTGGDIVTDFLVQVARKRGRLGKGGVPNLYSAASTVITDWRDGRIQGWVTAPKLMTDTSTPGTSGTKASTAGQGQGDHKEIVTEWAKEFQLEGLWGDGQDEVSEEVMKD